MSTYNKAKRVIETLLSEYDSPYRPGNDRRPLTIVAVVSDGETIPVGGYRYSDGNYIYTTGYNGSDSHTSQIVIGSSEPLTPFNDFYGDSSKYPVIAKISAALEAAGFDGLDGFGAGKLERKVATT